MNLYAILTLIFLVWLMAADFDFAAMGKYAREHKDDDLSHLEENYVVGGAGKVYDLILPIAVLIVLCIGAMLYTGGILDGAASSTPLRTARPRPLWCSARSSRSCSPSCCTSRARF